jgi:hypothetical protein
MAPVPTFEHNCISTLEVGVVDGGSGILRRGRRHRVPSAATFCNYPGRNRPPFQVQSAPDAACKIAVRQKLPFKPQFGISRSTGCWVPETELAPPSAGSGTGVPLPPGRFGQCGRPRCRARGSFLFFFFFFFFVLKPRDE